MRAFQNCLNILNSAKAIMIIRIIRWLNVLILYGLIYDGQSKETLSILTLKDLSGLRSISKTDFNNKMVNWWSNCPLIDEKTKCQRCIFFCKIKYPPLASRHTFFSLILWRLTNVFYMLLLWLEPFSAYSRIIIEVT